MKSLMKILEKDRRLVALKQKMVTEKVVAQAIAPRPLSPFIIAQLFREIASPFLVVTDNQETAQRLVKDLANLIPEEVLLLPDWEILPHERISPGKEIIGERMKALYSSENRSACCCDSGDPGGDAHDSRARLTTSHAGFTQDGRGA